MKVKAALLRPAYSAAIGFVAIMALLGVFAAATALGLINVSSAQRAMDWILGLMTLFVGNAIPKLRPFQRLGLKPGAARIELMIGWLLTIAGGTWMIVFSFTPLAQARRVAGLIALAVMLFVAGSWAILAVRKRRQDRGDLQAVEPTRVSKIVVGLLAGFFYVLLAACTKFLVDPSRSVEIFLWETSGFWLLYFLIQGVLGRNARQSCVTEPDGG